MSIEDYEKNEKQFEEWLNRQGAPWWRRLLSVVAKSLRTRYRIVRDGSGDYVAQFRYWWLPVYFDCFTVNLNSSIEKAEERIELHRPVKQVY